MARRGPTVAEAEAEVGRLEQAAAQWRAESAAKTVELQQLEATRGDQILDGADPRQLHAAAEDLRILIAGADGAAESADRKLVSARAEVIRARAREVRQRADAATKVADAHDSKVKALLSQVRELEGVDYVWREPEYPQIGVPWTIPTSDALRHEADQLIAEADALDAQAGDAEQGAQGPPAAYARRPFMSLGRPR